MEWSHQIITRIENGMGKPDDVDTLLDLIQNYSGGKTICAFADGAAMPYRTAILAFRDEWDRHVREGGCPFDREHAGQLQEAAS
jgi:NADH-quinone oxidoreductase subunit F